MFHSDVLAAGGTQAGVCFYYRTWKGPCSSFSSRYYKNLPPPLMPVHALSGKPLSSLCLPFVSTCLALSFQPVPSILQRLSSQRLLPSLLAPQPGQWPPCLVTCLRACRALCSQQLSALLRWAISGSGSGLPYIQHRHHQRIIYQSSTYEQWFSGGSLDGQVSTGTEEINPCHLNSFPAKIIS